MNSALGVGPKKKGSENAQNADMGSANVLPKCTLNSLLESMFCPPQNVWDKKRRERKIIWNEIKDKKI